MGLAAAASSAPGHLPLRGPRLSPSKDLLAPATLFVTVSRWCARTQLRTRRRDERRPAGAEAAEPRCSAGDDVPSHAPREGRLDPAGRAAAAGPGSGRAGGRAAVPAGREELRAAAADVRLARSPCCQVCCPGQSCATLKSPRFAGAPQLAGWPPHSRQSSTGSPIWPLPLSARCRPRRSLLACRRPVCALNSARLQVPPTASMAASVAREAAPATA